MPLIPPLNDAPKPRIPDAIDNQRLQAMQLVAKMKESANKYGVGFVGGFVVGALGAAQIVARGLKQFEAQDVIEKAARLARRRAESEDKELR